MLINPKKPTEPLLEPGEVETLEEEFDECPKCGGINNSCFCELSPEFFYSEDESEAS